MQQTSLSRIVLRSLVLATALAGAAAPSTAAGISWSAEQVQGSGAVKRQVRQVAGFTGLAFALPGQLELRLGDTESVVIETDANLLPLVETVVEGGTLTIRTTRRNLDLRASRLKVVVTARQIERLALRGSGSLLAETLRGPRLHIDIGGSGTIDVRKLDSESVAVNLGGSGALKAGGGQARTLSVAIGGSGSVDLGQVRSDSASVSVAGSGQTTVWARNKLDMSIAGSGDVQFYGDPQISKSVVGSGKARRIAAAPQ